MLGDHIHKPCRCEVHRSLPNALPPPKSLQQTKVHGNLSTCVDVALSPSLPAEAGPVHATYNLVANTLGRYDRLRDGDHRCMVSTLKDNLDKRCSRPSAHAEQDQSLHRSQV